MIYCIARDVYDVTYIYYITVIFSYHFTSWFIFNGRSKISDKYIDYLFMKNRP